MRAMNTSGRAVLFAGATVIVALLGLLVLGVSFLNGVAVAAAIVVLIDDDRGGHADPGAAGDVRHAGAVAARSAGGSRPRARATRSSTASGRAGRAIVQQHRVPLAAAALIVMLLLAVPALSLRLGSSDAGQDPPSHDHAQGLRPAGQGLRAGLQRHASRSSRRRPDGKADLPKVARLAATLRTTHGPRPRWARRSRSPNGKIALIEARPTTAPQDAATSRLIDTLRNDVVPQAASGGLAGLRRRRHRDLRRLRRGADRTSCRCSSA